MGPQIPPLQDFAVIEMCNQQQQQQPKAMDADFYRCLRAGQVDALTRMLDDKGNDLLDQVTQQENTPLHIVARQGHEHLIHPILARQSPGSHLLTKRNVNGDYALHLAAGAGHLAAVETIYMFLGDAGTNGMLNRDLESPLHVAVSHKHTSVANYLIWVDRDHLFSLNRKRESPLFLAAELGELGIVKAIIIASSNFNDVHLYLEEGKSVVHAAILGGKSEVLEAILSNYRFLINSPVPLTNGVSISPLSCAAMKGNIQMARHILNNFPDCTYTMNSGGTYPGGTFPIHIAAGAGHKLVLQEFLRLQPYSKESLTSDGQNILHIASLHGKHDVVSYILHKPDFDELINARDNNGNTPLLLAVAAKYPKVVDALTWDKRVRLDLVNNDGQTAMDLALKFDGPMPSLKQQLTWLALRYVGAPRRNFQQADTSNRSEQATTDIYKDQANNLSVVATLVTTVSFAAGFSMPGGNNGSDSNPGFANFVNKGIFQLFMISNSIALYASMLEVLVLVYAMLGEVKLLQVSLKVAGPLMATSLVTMSISFMSAAYLVVSSLRWLGIVVWVLGCVFLLVVLALFLLLFPPMSVKNRFTRYLGYLPFRAMLYICERN